MSKLGLGLLARVAFSGGALVACGSSDDDRAATGTGGGAGTGGSGGAPSENVYVSSIRPTPGNECLPRPLELDSENLLGNEQTTCAIVELRAAGGTACSCDTAHGRTALLGEHAGYVSAILELERNVLECDAPDTPVCSELCLCEITQLTGDALVTCETSVSDPGNLFGVCYVDPTLDLDHDGTPDANPELVADCAPSERRKLRFMGGGIPAPGALMVIACGSRSAAK